MPPRRAKKRPRSERPNLAEELAELRETIDLLGLRVKALTQAIDALTDEIQWRNNNERERPASTPPLVLQMAAPVPTRAAPHVNPATAESLPSQEPSTSASSGKLFD